MRRTLRKKVYRHSINTREELKNRVPQTFQQLENSEGIRRAITNSVYNRINKRWRLKVNIWNIWYQLL